MKSLGKRTLALLMGTAMLLFTLITTSVLCAASSGNSDTETAYSSLQVGIMSDIHLYDTVTGADDNLKKMLELYKEKNVDAILVTGDIANTNTVAQYQKFNRIWDEAFPNPDEAPVRLTLMGNHDYESSINAEQNTVEQAQQRFIDQLGGELNFNRVVNGYHFIGMSGEGSAVYGKFTEKTVSWLKEQLDAAVSEDPDKPIFVAAHQPISNTTYGSDQEGNTAFADLLKDYPQVVFFAGHCHRPAENERSIYQKDFTAVAVPSLQYVTVETGTAPEAFASQEALLLSVKSAEQSIHIARYKVQTMDTLKEDWVLSLPLSTETFTYTDARVNDRTAPVFPENAAVAVSAVTSNSCSISFPSATHDDYVQGYTVRVIDRATGEAAFSRFFISDFYIDHTNMAKTQKIDIKGLQAGTEYTIEVTASESFGLTSAPLTEELETFAYNTAPDGISRADILDVDGHVGFMDNSPYRAPYELYSSGFHPTLVFDETLGRQVIQINRWINYPTSAGLLKKIGQTVSMEAAFRVDTLTGRLTILSNRESGGIGLEVKDGVLKAAIRLESGDITAAYSLSSIEQYYHALATYDGQALRLYVNGELADETAASGTIYYNPAMSLITIGANPVPDGNAAYVFKGNIALARIYSTALDEAAVARAYEYYLHDPQYVAVYKNTTILKNLDVNNPAYFPTASTLNAISRLIQQGEQLDADAAITQEAANAFVDESNRVIAAFFEEIGEENPNPATPTTAITTPGESTSSSTEGTSTESTEPTSSESTEPSSPTEPVETTSSAGSTESAKPGESTGAQVATEPVVSGESAATTDGTAIPTDTVTAPASPSTGDSGAASLLLLALAAVSGSAVVLLKKRAHL